MRSEWRCYAPLAAPVPPRAARSFSKNKLPGPWSWGWESTERRKPSSQLEGPASRGPIFQQEQIARAVELGLGVDRPEKIRLLVDDDDIESQAYAMLVQNQLLRE